ncbi:MAG: hypothetical protein AAGD00_05525 [Planctomycetota bacterium]
MTLTASIDSTTDTPMSEGMLRRRYDEAVALLNELQDARRESISHASRIGREDPMRELRGDSAIDRAIDSTRDIVRSLGAMLGESNERLA